MTGRDRPKLDLDSLSRIFHNDNIEQRDITLSVEHLDLFYNDVQALFAWSLLLVAWVGMGWPLGPA